MDEDAHTVPADGGGGVFRGAAMTRRGRLRLNYPFGSGTEKNPSQVIAIENIAHAK